MYAHQVGFSGLRRGLAGAPAGAPGDVVTVGGDVSGNTIRADDTGTVWTLTKPAGWPADTARGVVSGEVIAPYTIGRIGGSGTYRGGERGTTSFTTPAPVVALVYTLPNGSTRPLRQFDLYYPGAPGNPAANPPMAKGGDPDQIRFLNRELMPAFIEDMKGRLAAGEITPAYAQMVAQRAIDLGWQPPPGTENAIWLPPGGGAVPSAIVTDTGAVHPDTLRDIESGYTASVLAYTAQKTGKSYDQVAQDFIDKLASAPGGGIDVIEGPLGDALRAGMTGSDVLDYVANPPASSSSSAATVQPISSSAAAAVVPIALAAAALVFFTRKSIL